MPVEAIAFGVATIAGLALFFAVRYARTEGSLWLASWPILMASAGLIVWQDRLPAAIYLEHLVGPWFPALQLAGARQFVGRGMPRWLVPTTIAVGIARALFVFAGWHDARYAGSLACDIMFYALAVATLVRATPSRPVWRHHALWIGIGAFLSINLANYIHDVAGSGQSTPFWNAWAVVGLANFAMQLGAVAARVAERTQESLIAARQETARTIAGGVAHDFNNLLMVIGSNTELVRARLQSEQAAETGEMLDEVGGAVARGATITQRLLEHVGYIPRRRPEPLDPVALLDGAADQARERGHQHVNAARGAPVPQVLADRVLLKTALELLIDNAVEGRPSGTVTMRARTVVLRESRAGDGGTTAAAGAYVVLDVVDDGMGIRPDIRSRVFEPFFTTRGIGRGLGLPAVAGIVGSMGGMVELQSVEAEGTTVSLWIPVSTSGPTVPTWPTLGERRTNSLVQ